MSILLLGPPVAEAAGDPVVVDTRKAIALLAYLAVEGRAYRRDALAGLLWPDYEPVHARGALRRTLSSLKHGLGGRWVVVDRASVGLEGHGVWTDVAEFTEAVRNARTHDHQSTEPCPTCRARLEKAVDLYRGEFMEGFSLRDSPEFENWELRQADALRRTFSEVLERLVENLAAGGDLEGAADHARRWLSLDPLHEPAHRRLMHLYARQGRRSDALRQYRECVSVLENELGVGPLPETTRLYEAILNDSITPPVTETTTSLEPTRVAGIPLIGRKLERDALRAALERAAVVGQIVVLEGEAGVGKSRLADEFLAEAANSGSRLAIARCYQEETGLTYSPVAEALRALSTNVDLSERVASPALSEAARLVPELAAETAEPHHLEGPVAQRRFLDGVVDTIFDGLAGPTPGVLFFDDVHWADKASIDLLAYAMRRLASRRLVVMFAWRPELMPPGHSLRRVVAQVRADNNVTTVSLHRFDRDEVRDLVRMVLPRIRVPLETIGRLYEESEGLPFFVVEYLTSLRTQRIDDIDWRLPEGAADLLASRIASVGELPNQVLTAAAAIGRSFDFETVRDASGRSADETVASIDELTRSGLIREVGGSDGIGLRYDFTHERLRTVVYERAGIARRRLLHKRIAESLLHRSEVHADASFPAVIARHYGSAGDDAQAARHFREAGERAAAVFASLEALVHFESALAHGHPDVASIRESIGDASMLLGRYRDALNAYESAAASADPQQLSRLEHKLGQVHHRRGGFQAAEIHFASALEATGEEDPALAARINADRSLSARSSGHTSDAFDFAKRALYLAERAGDKRALAQAHNILGILSGDHGRLVEAGAHLETSRRLADEARDDQARVAALNNLALFHGRSGAIERAIELTREGLTLCAAIGDRHREAALHNNLADLLRQAGRLPEAIAEVKIAAGMFSDIAAPDEMEPEIWKLVEW